MSEERTAPPAGDPLDVLRVMRGAVGSLRAAAETLERFPAADDSVRFRLLRVLGEEAERLSQQMRALEDSLTVTSAGAPGRRTVTPAALIAALGEVIRRCGMECSEAESTDSGMAGPDATLDADVATLEREFAAFLGELRRRSPVGTCGLATRQVDRHLLIDLAWTPNPADLASVLAWQGAALGASSPSRPESGLRAAAREHQGEVWFTLDRDGATAHVRLLLPLKTATG